MATTAWQRWQAEIHSPMTRARVEEHAERIENMPGYYSRPEMSLRDRAVWFRTAAAKTSYIDNARAYVNLARIYAAACRRVA